MPPKKASKRTSTARPSGGKKVAKGGKAIHVHMSVPAHMVDQIDGGGFWGDVWDGVKSVGNWVKDNKVISTVAGLIPDKRAQAFGVAAKAVGLGKRSQVYQPVR